MNEENPFEIDLTFISGIESGLVFNVSRYHSQNILTLNSYAALLLKLSLSY
jgi:hypothetical protein